MFGFNKKPVQQFSTRDMLFGDLPLHYWAGINSNEEPWTLFKKVKNYADKKNNTAAIDLLKTIINMPALESRHYLQAYFFLNQLQECKEPNLQIYGAVAEVSMAKGCDTLAVYADHSARYYNFSGKAIIWEHSDNSLDDSIDNILAQGKDIAKKVGSWDGSKPVAPVKGMARINFLTSHGLHFKEANQSVLFNDPLTAKIMFAMADVMQSLINKTDHTNKSTAVVKS